VSVHFSRKPWPAILICAALSLAPAAASASAAGNSEHASKQVTREERRAEREARREARATQRSERRSAKQATREATRRERQAEREARRSAREAERSSGSHTTEAPSSTEPVGGEPVLGEGDQKAPDEGVLAAPVGTRPSLTARAGCTLTAATSAAQVTVGESVTLSGKLTCPAGIEASGQEVTIDQRSASTPGEADVASSGLTPVATAEVAEDGSYEFHTAELSGRSTFVLHTPGTRHPARVIVRVGAAVTLAGSAASGSAVPMGAGRTAGGPMRMSFSGVVAPVSADIGVGLRVRYAGEEWRTVAITRTDAEGHYSFSHRFRYAGDVEVLTVSHPRGEQRTESAPLSYTIVQAQNTQLTIQSSAAATTPSTTASSTLDATPPAGTATTISGVAAGADNQTVTLLARSAAGHFAPVATVTADASGAYSFTVEPTQTTIYEVGFAKNRSTQVRVVVYDPSPAARTS
jgi:hypothetical protein